MHDNRADHTPDRDTAMPIPAALLLLLLAAGNGPLAAGLGKLLPVVTAAAGAGAPGAASLWPSRRDLRMLSHPLRGLPTLCWGVASKLKQAGATA